MTIADIKTTAEQKMARSIESFKNDVIVSSLAHGAAASVSWLTDITAAISKFSADQDVINPVGPSMAGLFNTAHWSPDFSNTANQRFMTEFQKEYKRVPTLYASQGYDAAQLINAAVRDVKGKLEDQEAVLKALKAARFDSVRGPFKFNNNQMPVQNYYVRTVGSDGKGGLINKSFNEPILRDHGDAYAQNCPLPR